jgi:predicted amidohydrolase
VSKVVLVAKPKINEWRLIVDLRLMNNCYVRKRVRMESQLGVRQLITRKGDYTFSFDVKDGFYARGLVPEHRDSPTESCRCKMQKFGKTIVEASFM